MIFKFLKQLFCFPHHYEQEISPFDDEWWEDCRKCDFEEHQDYGNLYYTCYKEKGED